MSKSKSKSWRFKVLAGASALGLVAAGWTFAGAIAGDDGARDGPVQLLAEGQGGKPTDRGGRGGQGMGSGQGQRGTGQGVGGAGGGSLEDKVLRGSGKAGAGGPPAGSGSKKGDLYGDLWVIVRDDNGLPILYVWTDTNGDGINDTAVVSPTGFPQPIAADGTLIPLDSEGAPIDATLVQEVELGRTNVARSPSQVLQQSLDTVLTALNDPTAVITLDPSGRLVVNGDTVDSPLENLALYLEIMNPSAIDGTLTATLPAGFNPASLLAAAADKGDVIGVDYVVYLNSILGVNTVVDGVTTSYYDYSTYNYDRTSTWSNVTATVLVLQDGVYVPTVVNIYETLFSSTQWTDPTATGGVDDFAQATDDYLKVITYLHDNSAPETTQ